MPQTSYDVLVRVDDRALDDSLANAQRRLRSLNAETARLAAAGRSTTQNQRAVAEQRKVVRALQAEANERDRIAEQTREQTRLGRIQNRYQRRVNAVTNRLGDEIERQRRAVIRSAVTIRALDDASPLVLARAGFNILRGGIGAGLGAAGITGGVAAGISGVAAAGIGALAAPSVIGLTGGEAAQSFEQVEALRRSLASLADLRGFAPTQQLQAFNTALRGTVTETEALRTVIAIERLGVPALSSNIGEFSADIANLSAATGESFDRIFRSVQRFISRGTFERIQDFLPNLDRDRVRLLEQGLDEVGQQAVRAQLAMQALAEQSDNTGNQFETGAQKATEAMRQYEVAIEALNNRWGEFAQDFVVDVRTTMTDAINGLIDLWDTFAGRLTRGQIDTNLSLSAQTDEELRDLLRLATGGDVSEVATRLGLTTRTVGRGARERQVLEGTSLEEVIRNLNALLTLRATPLDRLSEVLESGDFSAFPFVTQREVTVGRQRRDGTQATRLEIDYGVTGGIAGLRSLIQNEINLRTAQDTRVQAIAARVRGPSPGLELSVSTDQPVDIEVDSSELDFDQVQISIPFRFDRFRGQRFEEEALRQVGALTPADTFFPSRLQEDLQQQLQIDRVIRPLSEFRDVSPEAAEGVTELSNSVVYMTEVFSDSVSQMLFNARSFNDVIRGISQELFDQVFPNLVQSFLSRR